MPSTGPLSDVPEIVPLRERVLLRTLIVSFMTWAAGLATLRWLAIPLPVAGTAALVPAIVAGLAVVMSVPGQRAAGPLVRRRDERQRDDLVKAVSAFMAPLVLLDRREIVLAASGEARALLPLMGIGRPLSLVVRDPVFMAELRRVVRGEAAGPVLLNEQVPVARSLRVRFSPFAQERGERLVLALFEDLSEQQALERMRVDFVANASHELRTPLASLLGFIETLQGPARNDPPARDRFLAIMREQAQRMARLIDDLLSLSRTEMRAHLAPSTRVDLTLIAREIADSMSMTAQERKVRIELDLPSTPAEVIGDRDDLLRLLENLVENAIKYGASGGRVRLVVSPAAQAVVPAQGPGPDSGPAPAAEPSEPDDSRTAAIGTRPASHDGARPELPQRNMTAWGWSLSVEDFGPGIAAVHLPRLTERFYRVDVSHSREVGGTGLGLAIVKHVVARHRARLEIASQPDQGARFTILFPAVE